MSAAHYCSDYLDFLESIDSDFETDDIIFITFLFDSHGVDAIIAFMRYHYLSSRGCRELTCLVDL